MRWSAENVVYHRCDVAGGPEGRGLAEGAVIFEVSFVEPLIEGRIVGKLGIGLGVATYVEGIRGDDRGLKKNERAVALMPAFAAGVCGIVDIADRIVTAGARRIADRLEITEVDVDFHAKIDAAPFDSIAKLSATVVRILGNIGSDNDLATPANQFIDSQILEVTSVRQIDEALIVIGESEKFASKPSETESRATLLPGGGVVRIANPPAQAHVEDSEQKTHGRVGVKTHVGAGGGTRNSHGGAKGDAAARGFGLLLQQAFYRDAKRFWEAWGTCVGGRLVIHIPIGLAGL